MTKPILPLLILIFSLALLCCPRRSRANEVAIRRCLYEEDLDGRTCRLSDLPGFELERICERLGLLELAQVSMTTTPSGARVPREAGREANLREAGWCLQVKEFKSEHGELAWSNAIRAHFIEVMTAQNLKGNATVQAFAILLLSVHWKERELLKSRDERNELLDRGFREGPQVWIEWYERHKHHPDTKVLLQFWIDFANVPRAIYPDEERAVLMLMAEYDRTILERIVERRHNGEVTHSRMDTRLVNTLAALSLGMVALSVRKLFAMRKGRTARPWDD